MYILKNAFISITRNKGRNLLIGIIVVVIACATTIALAIRSSAKNLIESYENQYDVTATIGINRESMRGEMKFDQEMTDEERSQQKSNMADIFSTASSISVSDINNYGDSDYVKDFYYTLSVGVNSDSLEKASTNMENSSFAGGPDENRGGGKENFQNLDASDFTLMGYSSLTSMEDFISGKYTITEGELSSDLESMTCVINSELATLNGINVGDEITFVDSSDDDNSVTLKVVGIFEEESDAEDAMGMFTTSANTIITNTSVVSTLIENNEDIKSTLSPTFILTDKSVIEGFEEELAEKGLSEYLQVSTNLDQVEGATSTISNVTTFVTTFLIVTLVIGGIVLFVINMINIRERKYEIGVLRTIGMKKSKLTLQFISELLIVSFTALFIGAGIGAVASVPVSNYLLNAEIQSSSAQKENINQNFGGKMEMDGNGMGRINGVADIQAFDSIDAVVDFKVLIELLGIGTVLTLVSSCASMISIQKFSPLTILKERS